MKTTKLTITLLLAVVVLVLITIAFYLLHTQTLDLAEIAIFAIIGIIVLFAIYILWDKTRNEAKGLPAADERTKINTYKAGYYGFIAAIWSAVFTPIAVNIIFNTEMPVDYLAGAVVMISGLVFFISYLVLSRKGKL
ncbi:MAG: hypothetical protein ACQCN6_00375 [Candidatus Bathyarchaeia archaeon]|jgi:drug/metabolite transporter (DMT)-like permease